MSISTVFDSRKVYIYILVTHQHVSVTILWLNGTTGWNRLHHVFENMIWISVEEILTSSNSACELFKTPFISVFILISYGLWPSIAWKLCDEYSSVDEFDIFVTVANWVVAITWDGLAFHVHSLTC